MLFSCCCDTEVLCGSCICIKDATDGLTLIGKDIMIVERWNAAGQEQKLCQVILVPLITT